MEQQSNYFPVSPGIYIGQRGTDVVLFKLTGMYPTLIVGKALYLSKLIEGNSIVEAPKEIVANMTVFAEKWQFHMLRSINMDVFPKLSFKCNGDLDLTTDEYSTMKWKYYRLVQCGVSNSKILNSLMYEYKLSMEKIIQLVNQFDKEAYNHANT